MTRIASPYTRLHASDGKPIALATLDLLDRPFSLFSSAVKCSQMEMTSAHIPPTVGKNFLFLNCIHAQETDVVSVQYRIKSFGKIYVAASDLCLRVASQKCWKIHAARHYCGHWEIAVELGMPWLLVEVSPWAKIIFFLSRLPKEWAPLACFSLHLFFTWMCDKNCEELNKCLWESWRGCVYEYCL